MGLDHNVTITGTDPQNIRSAGDALRRLDQLKRDLIAMHDEFRREAVQIDHIVSRALTDHNVPHRDAANRAEAVRSQFAALADALETAHDQARDAEGIIHLSGVKLNYRPQWRPVATSWEPNLGRRR